MSLKMFYVFTMLMAFTSCAGGDFKTRQELISGVLTNGQVFPCTIALEIREKYSAVFDSAVEQCKEASLLERLPHEFSCSGECLRILHKHYPHIDIDKPDDKGDTPLHHAVQYGGDLAKVTYLVTHGAQLFRKNNLKKTPVDYAKASLEQEAQSTLLDACKEPYYSLPWGEHRSFRGTLLRKMYLPPLSFIDVLRALQKGTQTNILSSSTHPSFARYTEVLLNPPAFYDVIECNSMMEPDPTKYCEYYALIQMFQQLQRAEQQYFNPSIWSKFWKINEK